MRKNGLIILAAALACSLASSAASATSAAEEGQPVAAHRVTNPIRLDGRLDEADWAGAPTLDRFYEVYPTAGAAPSDHTAARFLYDDKYLYVGLRADLRDPAHLRTPFVRRDKVGASHDYMQVYIDPLGAKRNAYLFRVNARGVKTDGLQDEAKITETLDPDFDWDVATHIDGQGWSAELRIPLSTLRIARVGDQRWWVIATRGVPRADNTQMATQHRPLNISCFLCYASPLTFTGLRPTTENLFVAPSLTLSGVRNRGAAGSGDHLRSRPSLDLKWLPYLGGAVDLTVKPDFSQVEADSPQLTANARFALNLPEKRPFFREGLDLVSTPIPALYTRTVAEPDVGLRYTHRSDGFNGTAFIARDVGGGGIIEPGLLSSSVGFPTTAADVAFGHAKLSSGGADAGLFGAVKRNEDGSYNAVSGLDASWGSAADRVAGQVLVSPTRNPNRPDLLATWRGQPLDGVAVAAEWDHTGANVWSVKYDRYENGFRSWLGDVPRVDYQDASIDLRHPFFPKKFGINDVAPYIGYTVLRPLDRDGHEGGVTLGVSAGGHKNLLFDISVHPDTAVLTEHGEVRKTTYVAWTLSANPYPRVPIVQLNATLGEGVDFATGQVTPSQTVAAIVRSRPLDWLELEGRLSGDQLGGNPAGGRRLRETAAELIATWYFGPAFYLLADYQLYHATRRFPTPDQFQSSLVNLQFSWTASRDVQAFWGVRSGANRPQDPGGRGRSTEAYFKISRVLGLRV